MIYITGASKGIGREILKYYANKNNAVVGTYNNSIPEASKKQHYTSVDVRNYEEVSSWISINQDRTDDVLINCAGINYSSFAHKSEIRSWENVIAVNLFGSFNAIRSVLPIMRQKKFGRIINISSVVAQKPLPGTSAYAASKSALWGMSKSIAAENGSLNITINNINLGYVDAGMIEEVSDEVKKEILKSIPSKKFGTVDDVLHTINYIIETSYINGSSIDLSGAMI